MDPRTISFHTLKGLLKGSLSSLRNSEVLVGLLLRKGVSFVQSLVQRLIRALRPAIQRALFLADRLPTLLSRLSQAVGVQWFGLWFLCFNSRVLCMWKWTLQQLLNFEYQTSNHTDAFPLSERRRLRGLLNPTTMALSVLGGFFRVELHIGGGATRTQFPVPTDDLFLALNEKVVSQMKCKTMQKLTTGNINFLGYEVAPQTIDSSIRFDNREHPTFEYLPPALKPCPFPLSTCLRSSTQQLSTKPGPKKQVSWNLQGANCDSPIAMERGTCSEPCDAQIQFPHMSAADIS
eukprot:jgi/Botrbrau1/19963/Bobra.0059s0079.1